MVDPRDDRVSAAYRELPRSGPPPALDAAIQAAARRAAGSRPGFVKRWQIPVSLAAVLALAVGVSLQVDREKPLVADGAPVSTPGAEFSVPQAKDGKEERSAPAAPAIATPSPAPSQAPASAAPEMSKRVIAPPAEISAAKSVAASTSQGDSPVMSDAKRDAFVPSPPAVPIVLTPPAAPAVATLSTSASGASVAPQAARSVPQASPQMKSEASRDKSARGNAVEEAVESPEQKLERIAQLRAKGMHDEADRALAEFRRAQPDYRITEAWLRRVERR